MRHTPHTRRDVLRLGLCAAACVLPACSQPSSSLRTLTFWTLALSPFFDSYITERLREFERLNPGVRVTWVDVPYDAIERKLVTAAAAGRGPDVVNTPDLSFARFARAGAFADLSGRLDPSCVDGYLTGAISMCRIGGALLGLPWYVNPQSLMANTAMLRQGGLEHGSLPRDWAGIGALAREFRAKTGAFLFSQPLGEESQLPIMMLAEGLPVIGVRDGRLRSGLEAPEVLEYLARWRDLYVDGAIPRDAATRGHAHLTDLYQNGRLALINTGPNFLKRIGDIAPAIFESTVVKPGLVGALGRIHMPVMALSVLAASREPDLAARLAAHMTSAASQLMLCGLAAVMPSTRASLDDAYFSAPPTDKLGEARAVAARTVRGAVAFTPALGSWPMMRRAFEERFKSVLLGSRGLAEAMHDAGEEWDSLLQEEIGATPDALPRPAPEGAP